ncbi:hypothetical protein Kisp02_22500 [Kineosporia sp. NBRC 101731]|nr:hypothetical protein Kisp02_22500 [Kineosporia sp. NBRC 101731]
MSRALLETADTARRRHFEGLLGQLPGRGQISRAQGDPGQVVTGLDLTGPVAGGRAALQLGLGQGGHRRGVARAERRLGGITERHGELRCLSIETDRPLRIPAR